MYEEVDMDKLFIENQVKTSVHTTDDNVNTKCSLYFNVMREWICTSLLRNQVKTPSTIIH